MMIRLYLNLLVSVDILDDFIYDFITYGKSIQPVIDPPLPSYLDINLTLIGCRTIGQPVVFTLDQFDLRGKITLIDPDIIDESNKQRYLLAFNENLGMNKAKFLSNYLINNKKKSPHGL